MNGKVRWWQIRRLLALLSVNMEIANIVHHMAEEQQRHDEFPARIKAWGAIHAQLIGRRDSLREGKPPVSYAGMVGGRKWARRQS